MALWRACVWGRYADGGSNLLIVYKGCATVQLIESTCNCTCRHWEKKSRLCSSCLKHVLQLPNKTNTRCSIGKIFPSFSIIPSLHMNNTPHNIKRSSSDFTIMKGLGLLGQCNVPELSGIIDFEWFQKRSQSFHIHYQRNLTETICSGIFSCRRRWTNDKKGNKWRLLPSSAVGRVKAPLRATCKHFSR